MKDIVSTIFPKAVVVLDCFHVLKRCNDAVEVFRLKTKNVKPKMMSDVRHASSNLQCAKMKLPGRGQFNHQQQKKVAANLKVAATSCHT